MAAKWKNWHAAHAAELTFGAPIADAVAATMGSWSFIIAQSIVLALWIVVNVVAWVEHWDPYPFILLNLALSFQAAYAAPFIMISQNRQAERTASRRRQITAPMSKPSSASRICSGAWRRSN